MVHIIADSTADLGSELARQHNIHIVPLYVYLNGRTFMDGVDVTLPDLFHAVDTYGVLPKTSAPTVGDFQKAFEMPGEIVCLTLSSRLSATFQNTLLARDLCGPTRIYPIDSLNLTSGIGLLVLKAADLRDQGLSAAEIYQKVTALVPAVRTSFVVETLEYLHKGGRCSAMQSLAGSLLHIRPVVAVQPDGTLGVKTKLRGSRQKALHALLDDFAKDLPNIDLNRVFVAHTGCVQDAEYLRNRLMEMAPIENIPITYAGSVIASHCGPGTIGIMYLKSEQ